MDRRGTTRTATAYELPADNLTQSQISRLGTRLTRGYFYFASKVENQMGLRFENLDRETRPLMLSEIRQDIEAGTIYLSNYLTDEGGVRWPDLLMQAAREGNDDSLAAAAAWSFRAETPRRKPKGGFTMARVPVTASQTLAESQFNMYYMRALALRSIETGQRLQVYRAKAVDVPRASSEAMIGDLLDAATVLEALRATKGVEPVIGIPMPNSGITIRLIP